MARLALCDLLSCVNTIADLPHRASAVQEITRLRAIAVEKKSLEALEEKRRNAEELYKREWAETVARKRMEDQRALEYATLRAGLSGRGPLGSVGAEVLKSPDAAASVRSERSERSVRTASTAASTVTASMRSTGRSDGA